MRRLREARRESGRVGAHEVLLLVAARALADLEAFAASTVVRVALDRLERLDNSERLETFKPGKKSLALDDMVWNDLCSYKCGVVRFFSQVVVLFVS